MIISDPLGRFLKAVRTLHGLDQAEVAARLGVSIATVSLTENGHRKPSAEELQRHVEILISTPPERG